MTERRCANCIGFSPGRSDTNIESEVGECHAEPVTLIDGELLTTWAAVTADEWCMRFRPKQ